MRNLYGKIARAPGISLPNDIPLRHPARLTFAGRTARKCCHSSRLRETRPQYHRSRRFGLGSPRAAAGQAQTLAHHKSRPESGYNLVACVTQFAGICLVLFRCDMPERFDCMFNTARTVQPRHGEKSRRQIPANWVTQTTRALDWRVLNVAPLPMRCYCSQIRRLHFLSAGRTQRAEGIRGD
jgi:hypothetical protein